MKQVLIFTFLFLLTFILFGQNNLSGIVLDEKNKAVEFATVSIFPLSDSTNIRGVTTGIGGIFQIVELEPNSYKVVIQMLGFQDWEKEIELLKSVNLGKVILKEETKVLSEINVVAERSTMESRLGKKVLRIGQDLSSTGSNALEALENIPSVTTNQRGQVQIRGNSNVVIYINGKETRRDPATLKYISAENLEKIEIITNPSAKYDAEGVGGIINIVYKNEKNAQFKLESVTNLSASTNPLYWNPNGGLNMSWTKNRISLFSNISFDYGKNESYFDSQRNNFNDNLRRYQNHIDFFGLGKVPTFNMGFSFEPDSTMSIGLEVNFQRWDFVDDSKQTNIFEYKDATFEVVNFSNKTSEIEDELWINFSLEKKLKNKQNLKLSLTTGGEDEANLYESNDLNLRDVPEVVEQFLLNSDETERQRYYQGQVDYEAPFFNFGQIEAGAKADFIQYDILQKAALREENISPPTNDFTMNMQKLGVFLLQKHQIQKFEYAVGVRMEQFSSDAVQRANNETFTQDYLRFFPSVQFNFMLPDASHTLGFNYTRRINRPSFFDLNPFVSYSDPLNLTTGNPALAPEIANLYEVSYHKGMDKFSIDLTLYQRITSDGIQAIIQPYGNNQTLQTYINFAKETSQGIEAQMEYRMNKVFKTTASFVWGQMKFENPETQITFNNAKSWSARLQQQFKLSNDWKIEFTENYRAPRFSAQRKMQEWFYINFALNKKINKKRGSISLRVSDIFNTKQWGYSLVTDEFEVERIEKWQTRNITLGLRYYIINQKK